MFIYGRPITHTRTGGSDADYKLGLAIVMPNLLSAPELDNMLYVGTWR